MRFLPVSTGLRSLSVTAANPVLHFSPNRPFTNSLGWNMHNVVHGRVNNAGSSSTTRTTRAMGRRSSRSSATRSSKRRWWHIPKRSRAGSPRR